VRRLLDTGGFPALAYALGREAASGTLTLVEQGATHRLSLTRGYVCRAELDGHWAPLPQALRDALASGDRAGQASALARQLVMRLERLAAARIDAVELDPTARAQGPAQVALALWARRHAEDQLDAVRMRHLAEQLAGVRLAARKLLLPDPDDAAHGCDDTDRRLIEALSSPRRLDELERVARAPRFRVLAFVHFLSRVGALEPVGVAAHGAMFAGSCAPSVLPS
jgi:hypothetical protein